jgi:hypothetical protein
MAASQLTTRLIGLTVAICVIWYIAHLHGEIAALKSDLATPSKAGPARAPAPAAPAAAAPAAQSGTTAAEIVNPRTITPEQRQAMIDKLTGTGMNAGSPVWFATVPNNPEAAAFQKSLEAIFQAGGWEVKGNVPVRFSMKAGVFVFAAEEQPPDYVGIAQDAIEKGAELAVTSGRGYRDFYAQKKADNPNWIGFDMAPEQTYVVVVGRKPEEPAAKP